MQKRLNRIIGKPVLEVEPTVQRDRTNTGSCRNGLGISFRFRRGDNLFGSAAAAAAVCSVRPTECVCVCVCVCFDQRPANETRHSILCSSVGVTRRRCSFDRDLFALLACYSGNCAALSNCSRDVVGRQECKNKKLCWRRRTARRAVCENLVYRGNK